MASENLPPLDQEIVDTVNGLWPEMTWTQPLRHEWRLALGKHDAKKVVRAVRDHFTCDEPKRPSLRKVRAYLNTGPHPTTDLAWKVGEALLKEEARVAMEALLATNETERAALHKGYRALTKRELEWSPQSWNRNTTLILKTLLDRWRSRQTAPSPTGSSSASPPTA